MGSSISAYSFSFTSASSKRVVVPVKPSGCELVLKHEGARHAFVDFLQAGSWLPQLALTYLTYQRRPTMSLSFRRIEKEPQLFNVDFTEQNLLLHANEFQIVFPLFLSSPQYEKWVYDTVFDDSTIPVKFGTEVKNPVYKVRPCHFIRTLTQALKTVDREEVPYMHAHGDWIKDLIREVDSLPWSVSLSAARLGRPNFPLVYVNCTFMEQTGFQHDEIIGKPHHFFVCDKDTNPEEDILLLEEALRLAKPVRVSLTTQRKDGTRFTNLVVSKPMFDERGEYVYAISVQCAIVDPVTSQKLCQDVEGLLTVLPNILN